MMFLRVERLKEDLARAPLSARETAQYLAAQGMLLSILYIPMAADAPDAWALVLYPALALAGVYYCYRRNGGAAGERLAERYLAVGWVVAVRVALVFAVFVFAAAVTAGLTVRNLEWLDSPWMMVGTHVAGILISVLMYWRTGVHLGDIRRRAHAGHSAVGPVPAHDESGDV